MNVELKTLEYDILSPLDLYIILQSLICMGLNNGPIPSFTYDRYRKVFRVKDTLKHLEEWSKILDKNQKNYLHKDNY